jgi:hypothetical protein
MNGHSRVEGSDIKRRIIKFISFWVLFSLLFSILNLSMRIENKRWVDFYTLPSDSIDVVFLGNSHGFMAFQPKIIDDILPINSYVLGIGGENIVLSYYELKELLKYQHPKVVVLETFVLDLDDDFLKSTGYYDFLDAGSWSSNRTAVAARYLTPDLAYTIFPALRTRMDWSAPYIYIDQIFSEYKYLRAPVIDPGLGSTQNAGVILDSEYQANINPTEINYDPPSVDNQKYLEMFYELCRQNNIKLVFSTVPTVTKPQGNDGRYKPFDSSEFAIRNNISVIDYDLGVFNHLDFVTTDHVNAFGSMEVSIQTAQELAGILNLPIDQSALDYYRSFIFTDYTLTNTGNNYSINLTPADTTTSLKYRWMVQMADSKKVISQTEWTSDNSFEFTLDAAGDYRVLVEIKNPNGDYPFLAYFPITK